MSKNDQQLQDALAAVVRVGNGRGFVVEGRGHYGRRERFVITAAHCLPERRGGQKLPPPHGASYTEERTYKKLMAPLSKKQSVWCECLFVDPIADIAVLGSPDNQALGEQAEAYEALVEAATPLTVAEPPSKPNAKEVVQLADMEKRFGQIGKVQWARRECSAILLSLDKQWFACTVSHFPNGMLSIENAAQEIAGGMSGSPIMAEDGTAIGIVCLGGGIAGAPCTEGGPNPRLMGNLPGWFLKGLTGT